MFNVGQQQQKQQVQRVSKGYNRGNNCYSRHTFWIDNVCCKFD